ncbi:MAG TPA: hypothetical protein PLC54_00350 [Spirochaetales bacterium]|nr:hypothetical protein [Spirochaetales bacterium]
MDFQHLVRTGLSGGHAVAQQLTGCAAQLAGYDELEAYRAHLASKTVCLTMLAGAGTRWLSSLASLARMPDGYTPQMPRALFPVHNATGCGPNPIPIGAYALMAVRGLGTHVIVVRGWEDVITSRILSPLGIQPADVRFVSQKEANGKPRGHGDAAWQAMDQWRTAEYVLVNFGGDASSPDTAFRALATMDALCRTQTELPALVLPVASMKDPAYPIGVDADGLPVSFGHAKLQGLKPSATAALSYTNVGIRVYRAKALEELVSKAASLWRQPNGLWAVPGNDPDGGEFALDNVDAEFAHAGKARLLAIASSDELTPVKSLGDIPGFEKAVSRLWHE